MLPKGKRREGSDTRPWHNLAPPSSSLAPQSCPVAQSPRGWHGPSYPVGCQGWWGWAEGLLPGLPIPFVQPPCCSLPARCAAAADPLPGPPLLLGSLPSSHLGGAGVAVCWGTAGDRGLSPRRSVAHQGTHTHACSTRCGRGQTPAWDREHMQLPMLRAGGCCHILPSPPSSPRHHPPLAPGLVPPVPSCAHGMTQPMLGAPCPRVCEPAAPDTGGMALLPGPPGAQPLSRDGRHPTAAAPWLTPLPPRCTACRSCGAARPWPPRSSCSGITVTGPRASSRQSSPLSWRAG